MHKKTVLITGGTGLLGISLLAIFRKDYHVIATYLGDYVVADEDSVHYVKMDIQDNDGFRGLFDEFRPDVVIHTASIGSPDYAENNRELTRRINVGGTAALLMLCERYKSTFVYISSNGIYDGGRAPYGEDDIPRPVNYYGELKLEGERITLAANVPSAIVRPNILYGWHHPSERSNIVTLALSTVARGEKFMAYDDVYVKPLYVRECAIAILKIVQMGYCETFNIAGKDRVSIYGLVKRAVELFNLDSGKVIPVDQHYFNSMVLRPQDTSFNTDKMEAILRMSSLGIEEGLFLMKSEKALLQQEARK